MPAAARGADVAPCSAHSCLPFTSSVLAIVTTQSYRLQVRAHEQRGVGPRQHRPLQAPHELVPAGGRYQLREVRGVLRRRRAPTAWLLGRIPAAAHASSRHRWFAAASWLQEGNTLRFSDLEEYLTTTALPAIRKRLGITDAEIVAAAMAGKGAGDGGRGDGDGDDADTPSEAPAAAAAATTVSSAAAAAVSAPVSAKKAIGSRRGRPYGVPRQDKDPRYAVDGEVSALRLPVLLKRLRSS